MLLVANTHVEKETARLFLHNHGVPVPASEDFNAIGRANGAGKVVGVAGFNRFFGKTCAMHVAGDGNWLSKELMFAIFTYPFRLCEVNYIITTVASNNARSLRLVKHAGFEELFRVPNGWADGVDMVYVGMSKESCRWIKKQEQANELQAA